MDVDRCLLLFQLMKRRLGRAHRHQTKCELEVTNSLLGNQQPVEGCSDECYTFLLFLPQNRQCLGYQHKLACQMKVSSNSVLKPSEFFQDQYTLKVVYHVCCRSLLRCMCEYRGARQSKLRAGF